MQSVMSAKCLHDCLCYNFICFSDFMCITRPGRWNQNRSISFRRHTGFTNHLLLEHVLAHIDSTPVDITAEIPTNLDSEEFMFQHKKHVLQQEHPIELKRRFLTDVLFQC